MKGGARPAAMQASPPDTRVPLPFLIGVFVVAIVVGVLVAYLGITGVIGGPIP